MSALLNTIHDLINKYSILSYHVQLAKEKKESIEPEKIEPVTLRIGELINDLCAHHKGDQVIKSSCINHNLTDFCRLLQSYIDKLSNIYRGTHIYILSEIADEAKGVHVNGYLLYQVIENVIENSVNAGKSVISFEFKIEEELLSLKIVDCKKINHKKPSRAPTIPNGMGNNIITENLLKMNANIIRTSLNDDSYSIIIGFPLLKELKSSAS